MVVVYLVFVKHKHTCTLDRKDVLFLLFCHLESILQWLSMRLERKERINVRTKNSMISAIAGTNTMQKTL